MWRCAYRCTCWCSPHWRWRCTGQPNAARQHCKARSRDARAGLLDWSSGDRGLLTRAGHQRASSPDRRLHRARRRDPVRVRITARAVVVAGRVSGRATRGQALHHRQRTAPARAVAWRGSNCVSDDVIHSLWIPALNGKQDLIPGPYATELALTPRRHRLLPRPVRGVLRPAARADGADVRSMTGGLRARGATQQLEPGPRARSTPAVRAARSCSKVGACAMCHAIAGTDAGGHTGPDLTHLASRAGRSPPARFPLIARLWQRGSPIRRRTSPGANMPAVRLTASRRQCRRYLMGLP